MIDSFKVTLVSVIDSMQTRKKGGRCPYIINDCWGRAIYNICPKHIFNSNLAKSHSSIHPFQLSNRFDILHRTLQWDCRVLCKISKWLRNWVFSYVQTRLRKIWVTDMFWIDILYCTRLLDTSPPEGQMTFHQFQIKITNQTIIHGIWNNFLFQREICFEKHWEFSEEPIGVSNITM